jgi:hypothetical protein
VVKQGIALGNVKLGVPPEEAPVLYVVKLVILLVNVNTDHQEVEGMANQEATPALKRISMMKELNLEIGEPKNSLNLQGGENFGDNKIENDPIFVYT